MLIDAFMFLNEYDMLEGRLEYLYDTVDYFLIVEADHTHSGNKKEMNYVKQFHRYKKYQSKILYYPLTIDLNDYEGYDFSKPDHTNYNLGPWKIERDQRDHMKRGLSLFDPKSFVMIGDVDEVCTIQSIENSMKNYNHQSLGIGSNQEMFWYNFNQREPKHWSGTIMTTIANAIHNSPEEYRKARWNLPKTLYGYHMTYFMHVDEMKYKIESFSHQELNKDEFTNPEKIKERISKGIEPFQRPNVPLVSVSKESIDSKIYEIFSRCCKV
jgi:hypothetical protein